VGLSMMQKENGQIFVDSKSFSIVLPAFMLQLWLSFTVDFTGDSVPHVNYCLLALNEYVNLFVNNKKQHRRQQSQQLQC